jgi:F-type H+-transporting ATPase subunit gamma
MAGSREIRNKIKSVQNTRKITKAMEMVAASKMRKAQDRMRHARPFGDKLRNIAAHLANANPEYRHPFLVKRDSIKAAGLILVTTDKGLCGGLNTNVLRMVTMRMREMDTQGTKLQVTAIGNKGLGFMQRINAKVVSHMVQMGDTPHMDKLIGPVKIQLDAYAAGEIDAVYLAYNRFINTMKQEPVIEQLLPLDPSRLTENTREYSWDYLYEPDAQTVLDELLVRYVEALIYQAVAENMASEQSARMVAMKSASDNAKKVIGDLQLSYNKARQAAITKELSEIVSGAAAV